MDYTTKLFYKAFANIDPDSCVLVPREHGKLELEINDKRESFQEFIDPKTRTCMMAHVSNKELADSSPELAHIYFEVVWNYAITELDGKSIGLAEQIHAHNGLPAVVKMQDLLENPPEAWQKGLSEIKRKQDPADMLQKPETHSEISYWLAPEFVEKNPLYLVRRIWSFKLSEEKIEWFKKV